MCARFILARRMNYHIRIYEYVQVIMLHFSIDLCVNNFHNSGTLGFFFDRRASDNRSWISDTQIDIYIAWGSFMIHADTSSRVTAYGSSSVPFSQNSWKTSFFSYKLTYRMALTHSSTHSKLVK